MNVAAVESSGGGFKTSVQYSNSDFMLTPKSTTMSSVKRMGMMSDTERMDPDENNERLSAQVKAIQVLSTVRAMQDEIQDINQQIEAENKKLQFSNQQVQESSQLESEIEQLVSEMGLQNDQTDSSKQFFQVFMIVHFFCIFFRLS